MKIMKTETYWQLMRILATVALLAQGLYYCIYQPGIMDVFNAVMGGLVIYAIWFTHEKKRNPKDLEFFFELTGKDFEDLQ